MKILLLPDKWKISLFFQHSSHFCESLHPEEIDIEGIPSLFPDIIVIPLDDYSSSTIREIRQAKILTPILGVFKNSVPIIDSAVKVSALSAGADDVLSFPFDSAELEARLLALVRRANQFYSSTITIGNFTIDLTNRRAFGNDIPIPLTQKEYSLLECLFLHRNRVQTKEMIMDYLYNGSSEPSDKIIDVFICKIRRKINLLCGSNPIITIWGRGWMILAKPTKPTAPPPATNTSELSPNV